MISISSKIQILKYCMVKPINKLGKYCQNDFYLTLKYTTYHILGGCAFFFI